MLRDLGNYRKSYEKQALLERDCPQNPMELFEKWFFSAEKTEAILEANAMTLSTIGVDGFPKNRVVLLKEYTDQGFVFYTNYCSEKGKAIAVRKEVCLSFFWAELEQQIIVKGHAEKIEEGLSDRYFASRPNDSKLSALVSNQSTVIPSREMLHKKLISLKEKYEQVEIPRPKHWGGYFVTPVSIEFWQGGANRMHDRIRYARKKKNNSWHMDRLAP